MALVALVLSLLIAVLGAVGVASPARFISIVRYFETPTGLYLAAVLRLVMGVALFVSAPVSRAPALMRVLGLLIILAGVVTPLLGRRSGGAPRLLAGTGVGIRGWATITLGLGLLLAYAVAL